MLKDLPEPFLRPRTEGNDEKDHRDGAGIFLRLDQDARLDLVKRLVEAHVNWEMVNDAAVGGALRQAWHSEPYVDGLRIGSYLSAVAAAEPDGPIWSLGEIASERGDDMMMPEERELFRRLAFPLVVHRGGIGDPAWVAKGVNWTTDLEVARFYSETWPRRWGLEEPGCIVSMRIERDDAAALLMDRKESEVLVPDGVPKMRPFVVRNEGRPPQAYRLIVRDRSDGKGREVHAEPIEGADSTSDDPMDAA